MPDIHTDLTEMCLRIFHGDGAYGWGLLKHQWPKVAINEQRRKMAEVIRRVQSTNDLAAEVRRLSGCLLLIAGAEGCGNGSLRTAAFETASMNATVADLANKLNMRAPWVKRENGEADDIASKKDAGE